MARQSDTLDLLEVWGSLLANERMSTLRQGRDRDHEEQFRPIWGVYLFYTWLLWLSLPDPQYRKPRITLTRIKTLASFLRK